MNLAGLFRQTAIYGISTIVIRLASWILTPYYSQTIDKISIGINAELMAIIAVVNIFYMFGMETSYFRFVKDHDEAKVSQATMTTVVINSAVLTMILCALATPIVDWLKYPGKEIYIYILAFTAFLENVSNIPFAKLRHQSKAKKFVLLKAINVGLIVLLNIFFISFLYKNDRSVFGYQIQDPNIYIFLANLIPWLLTCMYFGRDILTNLKVIEWTFAKKILTYSCPLIIAGLAGMMNQMFDRMMLKNMMPYGLEENLRQLAIYAVNYKLTVVMMLMTQAFRMGAEPFFFQQANSHNSKQVYAAIMDFFIIAGCVILTLTSLNRDIISLVNESSFIEGIGVLPILLLAYLLNGIYYNASIWYRLTDQTTKGIYITLIGTAIIVFGNIALIPLYGYMGSAYATLACSLVMVVVSLYWGHRHYPIPYHFTYNFMWVLGSMALSTLGYSLLKFSWLALIIASFGYLALTLYLTTKRWIKMKQFLGSR